MTVAEREKRRMIITAILDRGGIAQASRHLGISRRTIQRRLKSWKLMPYNTAKLAEALKCVNMTHI